MLLDAQVDQRIMYTTHTALYTLIQKYIQNISYYDPTPPSLAPIAVDLDPTSDPDPKRDSSASQEDRTNQQAWNPAARAQMS